MGGRGNESHRIYTGYAETDCGELYPVWHEVDPATIGKCTGLTDEKHIKAGLLHVEVIGTMPEPSSGRRRSGRCRPTCAAQQFYSDKCSWRDWVLAQMAIIEAGQVETEQIFLPYLTDSRGRTLYEAYKEGQLAIGSG